MRQDLDLMRQRWAKREAEQEAAACFTSGDWGWVKVHAAQTQPRLVALTPLDPGRSRAPLEPRRPGTAEGGF